MSVKNIHLRENPISEGSLLMLPVGPSEEDYKISNLIKSFKSNGLETYILYSVCDIESATFYPDGILGLKLQDYDKIEKYLQFLTGNYSPSN